MLDAVSSGFGSDIAEVAFDSPDFEMLDKLVQNTFSFSGAKNWQELNDITQAMRDGDKLIPFSDFMEKVKAINSKYNVDWLRTEYDTAIASAQSAARWTEFEQDADAHPLLKYQTIGDSRVRYSHAILNGVTRPIKDDFWTLYYPPNGWNCRCEAVQAGRSEKQTKVPAVSENSVPAMFRVNLAQKGLVFPMGHPYYDGIPDGVLDKPTHRAVNKYYSDKAIGWIKNNVKGYDSIDLDNFKTGKVLISKSSLREIVNHAIGRDKMIATAIPESLADLKLLEDNIPLKKDDAKKKDRGVMYFNHYLYKGETNDYVVQMEVYDHGEKPYSIYKRQKPQ